MENTIYRTRYSKYGYGYSVRDTYAGLPCQAFWTWLTGKSLNGDMPKRPAQTLLKPWQMLLHISWGYLVFFSAVMLGQRILDGAFPLWQQIVLSALLFCLVVNRQRGFLHTFHYTIHGAGVSHRGLAKFLCKWVLSIPILHTPWDQYMKLHVGEHHGLKTFCTDKDVDLVFMRQHGFYAGMKESEFWLKLVLAPFNPRRIVEHIVFRLRVSFVECARHEIVSRAAYHLVLLAIVYLTGYLEAYAIYYLFPIFILTQFSSWIQHVSEHLWFARNDQNLPRHIFYGSLSWGRFFGRPYPVGEKGGVFALKFLIWALDVLFIVLPLRVFSFMQDLPSHDFHHRSPLVNFWHIAPERAAHENLPSPFGPMTETWGMRENFSILRDHLCRNQSDPFGIGAWYQENKTVINALNA
jgi:hypothetical protein